MMYSQLPAKFSYIIEILEIPATGRTGQISVMADDKTVYTFFLMPKEEYLEAQAASAIKILQEFDQRQRQIDREFPY